MTAKPDGAMAEKWVRGCIRAVQRGDPVRAGRRSAAEETQGNPDDSPFRRGAQLVIDAVNHAKSLEEANAWVAPFHKLWTERVGVVSEGEALRVLGPVRELYGDERALKGLEAYVDEPRLPDKPRTLAWFAEKAAVWIKDAETPWKLEGGVLTERGERLVRPLLPPYGQRWGT